jgi:aspartyl-tRNA(Asn)/glutamyl-tRNA(Gln) amidotransferase subunit A
MPPSGAPSGASPSTDAAQLLLPCDDETQPIPTLRELACGLSQGLASSRSWLEAARAAALRHQDRNALAWADWEAAARAADALDAHARSGRPTGALHGLPITIKDLYAVQGMPLAAGTRAPLPDLGLAESVAVARMRAAGGLIFAKTNMHEIALGATGENAWTGDVKNPHDPARQAGGSSSGAGVAVASRIGLAGLGSDTGGSVRIPAAFSGVVGFKPTFGAIPLAGALHLSWTCDHAGPLTRTVDDAALLFEVMAQRRTDHGHVARRPRLAVPAKWLAGRLSVAMRAWFERLLADLRAHADVIDVEVPELFHASAAYTAIVRAEAAYVHRAALAAGGEGFSPGVLAPMQAGQQVSLPDYLDAMAQRERLRAQLDAILRDYDALVLPTTGVSAPLRGQVEVQVESGTLTTREAVLGMTAPFSYVGLPTLSLPYGRVDALPGSLQVVGPRDQDAALLALGRWFEAQATRTAV